MREEYSVEELEQIVFNQSKCYEDSEAFQESLHFLKDVNHSLYRHLLYKEAVACGGLD